MFFEQIINKVFQQIPFILSQNNRRKVIQYSISQSIVLKVDFWHFSEFTCFAFPIWPYKRYVKGFFQNI